MAGNDLIGPMYAPDGSIVGMVVRIGDVYYPASTGPVMIMPDGTYWRLYGEYVNGVDSSAGVNPILQQVILS